LNESEGDLMKMTAAFLRSAVHLIVEDSFAISIFFVVVVATVFAFGFGVAPEIVGSVLVVGLVTALVESKLRAKK
jgi:hypothetical protein